MPQRTKKKISFFSKNIEFGGLKIHTEAFGKASDPACLLIAGKMCTARCWSDLFCQRLADSGFFVIRYDHRDLGESSEIDWQKTHYTMFDLASDAISILDCYGIGKANFIGYSMGGWICQILGTNFQERVISLVIISAGPIETTEEGLMTLTAEEKEILGHTNEMFCSIENGKTLEEKVQNFMPIWRYSNGEFELDEEMARSFTLDFLSRTKNRNAKNHNFVMQEFLDKMTPTNFLQKIEKPTLVIHGDRDTTVLLRHGKAVADAIPNSKFVTINGMGHLFCNRVLEENIERLIVTFLTNK